MSTGHKNKWILHKDSSRAHNRVFMQNPMSILDVALVSRILTVAHMDLSRMPQCSWETAKTGSGDLPGRSTGIQGLARVPGKQAACNYELLSADTLATLEYSGLSFWATWLSR